MKDSGDNQKHAHAAMDAGKQSAKPLVTGSLD